MTSVGDALAAVSSPHTNERPRAKSEELAGADGKVGALERQLDGLELSQAPENVLDAVRDVHARGGAALLSAHLRAAVDEAEVRLDACAELAAAS